MIRLLLMRHANAHQGTSDRSRTLSDVGRAAAARMAIHLSRSGWQPSHLICSDATRCQQTADILKTNFGPETVVETEPTLYLAAAETIAGIIRESQTRFDSPIKTLMILAHNPGLSVAASNWSGKYHSLTPASVARLTIDCEKIADALPTRMVDWFHDDARQL